MSGFPHALLTECMPLQQIPILTALKKKGKEMAPADSADHAKCYIHCGACTNAGDLNKSIKLQSEKEMILAFEKYKKY